MLQILFTPHFSIFEEKFLYKRYDSYQLKVVYHGFD